MVPAGVEGLVPVTATWGYYCEDLEIHDCQQVMMAVIVAGRTWPEMKVLLESRDLQLDEVSQAELRGRYEARHLAGSDQDGCKEPEHSC